jgi:hypothetical protein
MIEGRAHVLVPLDHESVLSPREPSHQYAAVRFRIEHDLAAIDSFLASLQSLLHCSELAAVPQEEPDDVLTPYWNNGYFSGMDARAAYAVTGSLAPRTILEVGSGHSTKFIRKAIRECGTSTQLVSIDPVPRAEVDALCDRVVRKDVNSVGASVFTALEAGDVLFWDGSHVVFNGADAVRLFLEILPALAPGVLVHIHDIALPFEYPEVFDGRGYAEQYLLAAYLLGGGDVEVVLPVAYLATTRGLEGGLSFWMRKTDSQLTG